MRSDNLAMIEIRRIEHRKRRNIRKYHYDKWQVKITMEFRWRSFSLMSVFQIGL